MRLRLSCALAVLSAAFAAPAVATTNGGATANEEPPPTTAAAPAGEPVTLTKSQTKRLQRALKVSADGVIGAQTRRALRRAERRFKLAVDGRPDSLVLDRLKVPYAPKPAEQVTLAPAQAAQTAVQAARSQVGKPYAHGGVGPDGFDCSGLTRWAFAQAQVELPHSSFAQYTLGVAVARETIRPGDLVFFDSAGDGASDVGIATSADTVVSATTKGVREHPIFDAYWSEHYVGARRLTAES